ncbi:50S ribosomal protein L33 [bacterium]|jgi:large subunit ribosomal protein L33|nr:50S ribosomal protein L33 [bacterium]
MAKKTNRLLIGFQCATCGSSNYVGSRNKINVPDKISYKKFCKLCGKVTQHKEKQKLK